MKKVIAITIFLILLDQLTKTIILKFSPFSWSCNPYIAFSLPIPTFITIPLSIVAIIIIANILFKTKNQSLGLIFVLSGAIGNLLDRIFRSCVIDFISIGNFPSFNLADAMITVGMLITILEFSEIKCFNKLKKYIFH